jgi:hypothetical protein
MASSRRIDALHKFESNRGFVAELAASAARIFHKEAAELVQSARVI